VGVHVERFFFGYANTQGEREGGLKKKNDLTSRAVWNSFNFDFTMPIRTQVSAVIAFATPLPDFWMFSAFW
jgi:hypothetical protein